MTNREKTWRAATEAGNRSMRDAGRQAWSSADWAAMVAEFARLCPPLELMPTAQIRAEVNRRLPHKPKTKLPCKGCGLMLGARERRKPCPECAARNPRKRVLEDER